MREKASSFEDVLSRATHNYAGDAIAVNMLRAQTCSACKEAVVYVYNKNIENYNRNADAEAAATYLCNKLGSPFNGSDEFRHALAELMLKHSVKP